MLLSTLLSSYAIILSSLFGVRLPSDSVHNRATCDLCSAWLVCQFLSIRSPVFQIRSLIIVSRLETTTSTRSCRLPRAKVWKRSSICTDSNRIESNQTEANEIERNMSRVSTGRQRSCNRGGKRDLFAPGTMHVVWKEGEKNRLERRWKRTARGSNFPIVAAPFLFRRKIIPFLPTVVCSFVPRFSLFSSLSLLVPSLFLSRDVWLANSDDRSFDPWFDGGESFILLRQRLAHVASFFCCQRHPYPLPCTFSPCIPLEFHSSSW